VVRTTPGLHQKISTAARREGVSLNRWIAKKLEQAVG
jgi:predicted HicB family RNase H-like nuclease